MKTYRIMLRLSLLSSIGLLVGAALVYFAHDFGRQERLETKLQSARSYSSMMTAFRHFYTQEIVSRLKEQGSSIAFSHDFKKKDNTLPLPATLTIELSKFLETKEDHPVFEMVSRHPFSNRPRKALSPFKERALQHIELGNGPEYFEVTDLDTGQTRLEYAQRILMKAECISCHNNHPQSARRDWAVGDVRGLQTVAITSDREVISVFQRMQPFLLVYVSALLAAIGLAYLFFDRNRRAIEKLKENARRSQAKSLELQEATDRLLEVEGYLSDAIASLPDGFVLYDKNDRLVLCNDKYKEIYATSADIIQPGVKFEDIIRVGVERGQYPAALDDPESWIERRMEFHYHPTSPVEQLLDDGRWLRVFEQQTEKGQIVGFRVDITELKQREQTLAEQESQLRATMESALDGIVVIDEQGIIREFNDAACKIFGFEQQEAIGHPMAELIIPSQLRAAHHKGMEHYRKTGEGPVLGKRITVPGLHKDGREITLELAINPALSSKGELFIAYMRDITENLAQQKALEEAKAAAEQAAQAKSAFLAIMSHEIRTPLNGLLGLLEILERESSDPGIHRKSVTALNSAVALTELLNSILDYSRLDAGKVALKESEFELRPFLKKTMDLVLPSLEKKGIIASVEVDPELPQFVCYDEMRLRQMLLNLLGNAVKFTKQGSVVLNAAQSAKADKICFHVEDTGIGIAAEDIPKLFERFNTLDSSYNREVDGSGLGLSITKSLADLMDGSIVVFSKPDIGTTFTLELPLREGMSQSEGAETAATDEFDMELSGRSVLLAEDNPTSRLVLGSSLQSFGMLVTEVEDGLQAVQEIQSGQTFDLIILDISMPIMDGLEAVGHIREILNPDQCLILAFTAYDQDEERNEFLKAGFDEVLWKPTRRSNLMKTISNLLENKISDDLGRYKKISSLRSQGFLDHSILEAIFEDIPMELAAKLARNCLNDMRSNIDLLSSSWPIEDWKTMHRASHILKGITESFGMIKLAAPVSEIADLTRQGLGTIEKQKIKATMNTVQGDFDATLAVLEEAFEAFGVSGFSEISVKDEE